MPTGFTEAKLKSERYILELAIPDDALMCFVDGGYCAQGCFVPQGRCGRTNKARPVRAFNLDGSLFTEKFCTFFDPYHQREYMIGFDVKEPRYSDDKSRSGYRVAPGIYFFTEFEAVRRAYAWIDEMEEYIAQKNCEVVKTIAANTPARFRGDFSCGDGLLAQSTIT